MAAGKITSRSLSAGDYAFFQYLADHSGEWLVHETQGRGIEEYIEAYSELDGEWRVWEKDGERAGVTFHVRRAPSNRKPWLGTILVHPDRRGTGLGCGILLTLGEELAAENKAVFAAVPASESGWLEFLSKSGFEQYKSEKDEGGKEHLLLLKPLQP
ncbi:MULTISPECIES: GNAT family N-acetyltransferase [Bacillaceae]|uniref:GNAT family N-acetyltransferase n=1 Tax=Bacillaceae TaxID=186817 RepID=UPI002965318A|nr:GNAT family N-acetyltransferase [Bacillus infantis]MDW2877104.1 GNAT family N-acetyltransferase [Bacillus infantis]